MSRCRDGTLQQEMSFLVVSRFSGGAVKGLLHVLMQTQAKDGSKFKRLG